ncbi:pyruvate ferredoxin oxidoreductase, partial [Myxococcota bacterium]|nr:pyruvate ferredoxin oxidoreductase [Myxococcota bacterium]
QQDSLSMRDTGWLQYYCADNQEILDSVIMGYRIGEKIGMPVMVILDAFVLSHTAQEVFVPELEAVKEFLPNFENPNRLDTENPAILGGLTTPEFYPSFRRKLDRALALVPEVEAEVEADFERIFGRKYTAVEGYMHEDAEILMVTSATLARTVKVSIDAFRKAGVKVGVLRIRRFRPFPNKQVQEMLKNAKKVIVVDRNISLGGEGIFATEIKAALYGSGISPKLYTYIAGLGGNDITPEKLTDMITYAIHTDEPWKDPEWIGLLPTEEEKAAAEAANEVQA